MLLGIRDLTEQEFSDWKTAHHNAAIALENREAKLDQVYDTVERDLDILGATAIEDKLQVRTYRLDPNSVVCCHKLNNKTICVFRLHIFSWLSRSLYS